MDRIRLKVRGMDCQHCAGNVEQALRAVDGVAEVRVSLEQGEAEVLGDSISLETLIDAVKDRGYQASAA